MDQRNVSSTSRMSGSVAPAMPSSFGPRAPASARDGASSDAIEALLARFPTPVTLRFSRLKLVGVLAISAVAVGLCVALLQQNWLGPRWAGMALGCIVVSGAVALTSVVVLLRGAASLTLDQDGFEGVTLFGRSRTPWRRVDNFRVCEMAASHGGRMRLIGYDDSGLPDHDNPVLTGSYGLPPEEVAALMRQWRLRAVGRPR
jgi:hypothetical protein